MLKWLWITFIVVFIDQITKWMAEAQIEYTTAMIKVDGIQREVVATVERIPVFDHLNWSFAFNYGAAFNFLGDQAGWQRWFFVALSAVISLVIFVWMTRLKKSETAMAIGLSLVLGGAVGNLIDRLLHGRVIDFIDVYADLDLFFLHNGHFSTFNVADMGITVGAFVLILTSILIPEEEVKVKNTI